MVLTDTPVWSLALRRQAKDLSSQQLDRPIRQEILSGVRHEQQFVTLEQRLTPFRDIPIETVDYVEAARFFNTCREHGVTGAPIDLLIFAVAYRYDWPIFSMDSDFDSLARLLPIRLHQFDRVES